MLMPQHLVYSRVAEGNIQYRHRSNAQNIVTEIQCCPHPWQHHGAAICVALGGNEKHVYKVQEKL